MDLVYLKGREPFRAKIVLGEFLSGSVVTNLDPVWLWLWLRPAAAAPIGPLVWKLTYTAGAALKSKTKRNILMV